jgi:hypothetical protein
MRRAKRSKVHVIAVRWTFTEPVTLTEARAALSSALPERAAPRWTTIYRMDEIKSIRIHGRLATKKEAADAKG